MTRPAWKDDWHRAIIVDVAVQAFGKFCAICERYIPQDQRAWRASNGRLIEGRARPDVWHDTFVLCPTCARATRVRPLPAHLLRPDVHRTFALDESAPFHYELRDVVPGLAVVVEGARLLMPEGQAAVVVPTNDAAAATLRYFALDVPLATAPEAPSRAADEDDDLPTMIDPRVELRTDAWKQASEYVERLRRIDEPLTRRALLGQVSHLIKFGGYWSVWATVLWNGFGDVELLASLLLPPEPSRTDLAAEARTLSGGADWHPATRADWLPTADAAPQGSDHG